MVKTRLLFESPGKKVRPNPPRRTVPGAMVASKPKRGLKSVYDVLQSASGAVDQTERAQVEVGGVAVLLVGLGVDVIAHTQVETSGLANAPIILEIEGGLVGPVIGLDEQKLAHRDVPRPREKLLQRWNIRPAGLAATARGRKDKQTLGVKIGN